MTALASLRRSFTTLAGGSPAIGAPGDAANGSARAGRACLALRCPPRHLTAIRAGIQVRRSERGGQARMAMVISRQLGIPNGLGQTHDWVVSQRGEETMTNPVRRELFGRLALLGGFAAIGAAARGRRASARQALRQARESAGAIGLFAGGGDPSRPHHLARAGHTGAVDASGKSLAGDFDAQVRAVFAAMEATLTEAGGKLSRHGDHDGVPDRPAQPPALHRDAPGDSGAGFPRQRGDRHLASGQSERAPGNPGGRRYYLGGH